MDCASERLQRFLPDAYAALRSSLCKVPPVHGNGPNCCCVFSALCDEPFFLATRSLVRAIGVGDPMIACGVIGSVGAFLQVDMVSFLRRMCEEGDAGRKRGNVGDVWNALLGGNNQAAGSGSGASGTQGGANGVSEEGTPMARVTGSPLTSRWFHDVCPHISRGMLPIDVVAVNFLCEWVENGK